MEAKALLPLLALHLLVACAAPQDQLFDCTASSPPSSWAHLRRQLSSSAVLALPGSAAYKNASEQFARSYHNAPYAVVQVANTEVFVN